MPLTKEQPGLESGQLKEVSYMLISIIITVLLFGGILKLTGWLLKATGKIFGAVLGFIGYLLLGFLAIGALGLAVITFPIILAAGVLAVMLLLI